MLTAISDRRAAAAAAADEDEQNVFGDHNSRADETNGRTIRRRENSKTTRDDEDISVSRDVRLNGTRGRTYICTRAAWSVVVIIVYILFFAFAVSVTRTTLADEMPTTVVDGVQVDFQIAPRP